MQEAVDDVISFMNDAIENQKNRLENTERSYYTDDDRARFNAKVWRIREFQPTLESLPDLVAALQASFPYLNQEAMEREHEGDMERANQLSAIADQMHSALQKARQTPSDFLDE